MIQSGTNPRGPPSKGRVTASRGPAATTFGRARVVSRAAHPRTNVAKEVREANEGRF